MVRFFGRNSCPVLFPSWKQPLQPCFSWEPHSNCTLDTKGRGVRKMENPWGEQKWNAQAMCQGGGSLWSG